MDASLFLREGWHWGTTAVTDLQGWHAPWICTDLPEGRIQVFTRKARNWTLAYTGAMEVREGSLLNITRSARAFLSIYTIRQRSLAH